MLPPTPHPAFDRALQWLNARITDPTGARYATPRTPEERQHEFEAQIARMTDFLTFAGNPHTRYPAIHVAGTSGKGSVTVMLAALLTGMGYKTGAHVSPYLQLPNEKLLLNGHMIPPTAFVETVDAFRTLYDAWAQGDERHHGDKHLRYEEAWTALAFCWLARQNVDWAVIETAMGGRYDPTNLLPARLAVITNVGMDHETQIGPTLTDIAWHKAGIIKKDALAITAETKPEVLAILQAEADAKSVTLHRLGEHFDYTVHHLNGDGAILTVHGPHHTYTHVQIAMRGKFQPLNAALALAALDLLFNNSRRLKSPPPLQSLPSQTKTQNPEYAIRNLQSPISNTQLPITHYQLLNPTPLRTLQFPGRMEVLQTHPTVLLDGAHNPDKMAALVESVQTLYPGQKATLLFGALKIKNATVMLETLLPIANRFLFAPLDVTGKPSSTPHELATLLHTLAPNLPAETVPSPEAGITLALATLPPDALLLITGSIYFIGLARDHWHPKNQLLHQISK
jgi:dihydrofolate synthase/folylpolyglutamate synthase